MIEPNAFLAKVEAFLVQARVSPTAFGRDYLGDPNFVFDLRKGRQPRYELAQRVEELIQNHGKTPRRKRKGRSDG